MPKEGLEPPFLTEPRSKRGVSAISPFGLFGDDRARTCYHLRARQTLYQMSYTPLKM